MLNITKKTPIFLFILITCLSARAQEPVYDDLQFAQDSMTTVYAPSGSSYVFVRSRRGSSGVNHTDAADSAVGKPVKQIVLVYSETNPEAIADREEYNRERWENLMMTYPEFFQPATKYKDVCQCSSTGDTVAFKQVQGFYIYLKSTPAQAAAPAAAPAADDKKVAENKTPATEKKVVDNTPAKQENVAVKTPAKTPDPVPEPAKVPDPPPAPAASEETDGSTEIEIAKTNKKKPGYNKPKRSKDKKACRPACYGYGDEDLAAFFKDNITLSKKQRRRGKKLLADVKLTLNFDGTVKKAAVTCADETFKQQVVDALKTMSAWNPMVKNGVTVKSDVKITLKYDKPTKSIKPMEVAHMPKPAPKCKCVSDQEIFGSN